MGQRLVVSEFPNDNPELHDGLVWACPTPCAPALPTLRLRRSAEVRLLRPDWEPRSDAHASAAPLDAPVPTFETAPTLQTVEIPEPLDAEELHVEPAPPDAATETSGFEAFIAALAGILAERGATRAAANVGALLGRTRLARDAFDAETRKTLVARNLIDAKTARPTPEFSVVSHAWREVLDGTGGNLSACGNATLDVFGAELLAALLGAPRDRTDELRRALRQRGVAAFGMLAAA